MDAAQQIDLSRNEAPAQQVLQTSLGEAAFGTASPVNHGDDGRPETEIKYKSRGAYSTTSQPRLDKQPFERASEHDRSSPSKDYSDAEKSHHGVISLPPMDEGFGAWAYVASAFSMYIVVWGESHSKHEQATSRVADRYAKGFPQAFPIFSAYLTTGPNPTYAYSAPLALLAPGIQDIIEGILFPILARLSRYRSLMVKIGIVMIVLSLLLASYATKPYHILLSQGVLFGIGGVLLNYVHVSALSEWFDKKKGRAMGFIWLGYRVGSLVFPLVCQALLDRHGFSATLRVLIAPILTLLLPSIVCLKGRYHASTVIITPTVSRVSKLQALRTPSVLLYLVVAVCYALVLNVPKMFIMAYGADLSMSRWDQAMALALHQLMTMVGTYSFGLLSESTSWKGLLSLSAVSTSLMHFIVWGFAKDKFALSTYAAGVGLTVGGMLNKSNRLYDAKSGNRLLQRTLFVLCRSFRFRWRTFYRSPWSFQPF